MKRWIVWVAIVSLGAAVLSSESVATVTFYTDRNAFLSVVDEPSTTTVNFEGLAPPGGYAYPVDGYTTNGVTFTDLYGYLTVVDPAYAPSFYDWNSGASVIAYYYGDPVQATLPGGKNAVGADVMVAEYYQGGIAAEMTATITLADLSTVSETITTFPRPNRAFMGFTADQSITRIEFFTPGTDTTPNNGFYPFPVVDNVTVSTIPEPVMLGLVGLGFGVLLALRRRR